MVRLAIVRDKFLHSGDLETFAPLAKMGFELHALGTRNNVYGIGGNMPEPFKTIRYDDIRKVDWSQYDVIDAPEVFHNFTAHICHAAGKKTFVTCWDLFCTKSPDRQVVRSKAKHFIARSPKTKQMLLDDGIPESRITVIPASVDTIKFAYRNRGKVNNVKFLYVGRIVPQKGIDVVRRVFTRVNQKLPSCELLIAGKGQLGLISPSHSNVKYLGFIDRKSLHNIYNQADVFVSPSLYEEQFGLTFIEAMSSGLPVITSDSGSIPWIVEGQVVLKRNNGTINENVLYEQMLRLATDHKFRSNLSEQGRNTVINRFDNTMVAKALYNTYAEGVRKLP